MAQGTQYNMTAGQTWRATWLALARKLRALHAERGTAEYDRRRRGWWLEAGTRRVFVGLDEAR